MADPISATVAFAVAAWTSATTAVAVGLTNIGVMAVLGEGATIALSGKIVAATALAGLSAAATALMRPNTPSSGSTLDFKPDPKAPVRGAMGYTALGGNKVFQATWGYNRVAMSLGVALSLGPIDAVTQFQADGSAVSFTGAQGEATGFYAKDMWQTSTLGLPGDDALLPPTGFKYGSPGLTGWGSQNAAPQVSFAFWTMLLAKNPEDRDVFTNGVPDPRWVGRWMKLWDPRKDSTYAGGEGPQRRDDWRTWEWSESPYVHALAWYRGHFKLNLDGSIDRTKRIAGVGAPDAAIDIAAFVEGMNVAEANDWTISGEWSSSDPKAQVGMAMLQAGGGQPINRGAQISVLVNMPRVSTYTYTKNDLIGNAQIRPLTPRRDRKNTIIPRYKSEANNWEYVPAGEVTDEGYRAEDRGEPRSTEVEYIHVRSAKQAGQLAAYDLVTLREGLTATLPSKVHLMHVHAGDCITVDEPELAMVGQKFVVMRTTTDYKSATVTLELRSETDAKHAFALGQVAKAPPSPTLSAVDPKYMPPPVAIDWTIAPRPPVPGGTSQPVIIIDGKIETTDVASVIIEHGPAADGPWTLIYSGAPSIDGRYEGKSLVPGAEYWIAVRHVAKNGTTSERMVQGPYSAPDLVADVMPNAPGLSQIKSDIEAAFGDIFAVDALVAQARADIDAQGVEIAAARGGQPNLNSRIVELNQARIDGDTSNATAISLVQARTANTEADIIDIGNALATETGVRAEQISEISARLRQGSPNLLPGGDFYSLQGWYYPSGAWQAANYPTVGRYAYCSGAGEGFRDITGDFGGRAYSLSAEFEPTGRCYLQFWSAGYGTFLGGSPLLTTTESFKRVATPPTLAPSGTAIIRVVKESFGPEFGIARIAVQNGAATDWRDDETVAQIGASVTEQALAIIDLENNAAIASWQVKAAATPGKPAVIQAVSSTLGSFIALGAEQIYFGDNTVFDDATDTIQTVWGTTRKAMAWGEPFGPDNLVEWTGPSSIALSAMSKANAGFWVDQTGAYGPTPLPSFWAKVTPTQITRSRTGAGSISTAVNDVIVTCYTGTSGATCTWSRVSGDPSISFPSSGFTPTFGTTLAAGETKTALFVGLVAKGGDVDLVYVNVEFSDNV